MHLGCFYLDNKIVIDYPILRSVLKFESESTLIQHFKDIFASSTDKVDVHLNMKKFTSTDAIHHIHLINKIIKILSAEYPNKLNTCYIYHSTPLLSIYSLFNDNNLIFVN